MPAGLAQNTLLHPVTRNREKFITKIVAMMREAEAPDRVAAHLGPILLLPAVERRKLKWLAKRRYNLTSIEPFLKKTSA
jgi:hypothetical protein